MDPEEKVAILATLSFFEYISICFLGDVNATGLCIRALKRDPIDLAESLRNAMVEFEAKITEKHNLIQESELITFNAIISSYKKHGINHTFHRDVKSALAANVRIMELLAIHL